MKIRIKRKRLAKELARKSLSLNAWGKRLGLSKGHLSLLLNGRRRYPNPETRRKLLEGLSLRFEDLFEFEEVGTATQPHPTPSRQLPQPRKGEPGLNIVLTELKYAFRTLMRRPGLTLASVMTLALGIGAATAIFGVVEAVLLRPLPFKEPHRLTLLGVVRQSGGRQAYNSRPEFLDLSQRQDIFQAVAASEPHVSDWTGLGEPRQLSVGMITAGFFPLLGVEPILGRSFSEQENRPGADPVVILSHSIFQSRFAGSESALQDFLELDGVPHRVVGVMPPGFGLLHPGVSALEAKDVWLPMPIDSAERMRRRSSFTRVVARLQPGISWERAQAEVDALAGQLALRHPNDYPSEGFRMHVLPLEDRILGGTQPILVAFLGAVGLLLLLVCFNLATLQLARSETRQGELTVRMALGASRWRLLRQSLAEGTLLALAGALLGVLSASWGMAALRSLRVEVLPRLDQVGINGTVLAAALIASLASLLLFSLAPAWLSTGMVNQTRIGSGRATASRRHSRVRSALVVAEVALALLLLTGSGLMMRSFVQLLAVDPGFDPSRVLAFRLVLPERYSDGQRLNFFENLQQRLEGLPTVDSVGLVDRLPLHWTYSTTMSVQARDSQQPNQMELAQRYISGRYFDALGVDLLQGRTFDSRDQPAGQPVAIIDGRLAERLWPDSNPLGKQLKRGTPDSPAPWASVVGVVRHVKHRGLDVESPEQVYFPLAQHPFGTGAMFVTVQGRSDDMQALTSEVRNLVWSLDRDLPLAELMPMSGRLSESLSQRSFNTLLFGLFACFGLALGAVGILGVVSHSVSRRIREIGLRMALGAGRAEILRWVVGSGMRLTALGVALGLIASLALTRSMSSLLFGIGALDPPTLIGAALFLTLVALSACYIPARRASRVDPVISLRWE